MNVLAVCAPERGDTPRTRAAGLSLSIVHSRREFASKFREARPDVVVVERRVPGVRGMDLIERLLSEDPSIPILIVDDIDRVKPENLSRVVTRSMAVSPTDIGSGRKGLASHARPELHDPTSGRVDARRVAAFFGLSLSALARLLGRSPQAVHKTPDAPGLQERLSVFVRIATALSTVFGGPREARIWLNAPNPELDRARPIELVKNRKAEIVAEVLEDALLGHPG